MSRDLLPSVDAKYHLYGQCPLLDASHRHPSSPCHLDTSYVSQTAKRNPLEDLATAPGPNMEVRSAPAGVGCVTDTSRTHLGSRYLPSMAVASLEPQRYHSERDSGFSDRPVTRAHWRPVSPVLPLASSLTLFMVVRLTRPQVCPGHLSQG